MAEGQWRAGPAFVGVGLVYLAYGLITNYRGIGDWWFESEEHRRRLPWAGSTIFQNRRESVPTFGYIVGVLGVGFLIGGFSLVS